MIKEHQMGITEITAFVSTIVKQSLAGQEIENPKVDCKSIWYDLRTEKGKTAFIKDTCSIANTFGPDGFIIIGYDDKLRTFQPVSFIDSGLRDTSDLGNLINKHVDQPYDIALYTVQFSEYFLNILHIPPSLHKPHVIREHRTFKDDVVSKTDRHRVFVRKGTGTQEATKYDFDLMYYDRKNITPEYELRAWVDLDSLSLRPSSVIISGHRECTTTEGRIKITCENTGRRPISIKGIELKLSLFSDASPGEYITIRSESVEAPTDKLLLPAQGIVHLKWQFQSSDLNGYVIERARELSDSILTSKKNLLLTGFMVHTTNNLVLTPRLEG